MATSPQLLELVLQIVTLYYGGHLVIFHEITGGELVSFLLYQVSLAAAIDVSPIKYFGLACQGIACAWDELDMHVYIHGGPYTQNYPHKKQTM